MDLVLETSKGPKTCITLEVKPYDTLIDLDALASEIFIKIKPEGLTWKKEYKVMPIAFGLKKIVLACIIEDEKVIVDDVMDKIADLGEISVDFSSFTKI